MKRPLRVRVLSPLQNFLSGAKDSGFLLFGAALVALVWANSPLATSYFALGDSVLGGLTLRHWINDGLMAIFFALVGLEIKRELLVGELSSRQKAALPAFAAVGGMAVPALLYFFLNAGKPSAAGWGVPMATDIAFALGVLSLLGNRIPVALKVFLAALAIVDDLGAVLVIAIFYTKSLHWLPLGIAAGLAVLLILLSRFKIQNPLPYVFLGIGLWAACLFSGIHATIAGVIFAFTIPARSANGSEPLLERMEHGLSPWVNLLIVPLFALANAGVALTGISTAFASPISFGVMAGLVVGKPIGIGLFAWLAVKLRLGSLPENVSWPMILGVGVLGGIGFTMSLFIAELSFPSAADLTSAKIGIVLASLGAGVIGLGVLRAFSQLSSDS